MGSAGPEDEGGGGGGGGGGNGAPTGWVGPWNVLGIGGRDDKPSARDIRRRTPAFKLEAKLEAKLATRTKPGTPKYEANVNRLRAIREIIAVAGQLGIDPNRQTRRVVREIQRSLGVPLNLRAIEKGNAPDVFVNLAGVTAAIAAETLFRVSPPSGGGTFPGEAPPTPAPAPRPAPAPQPARGSPPGLPSSWWDWQLWQRALYGGASLARTILRPRPGAAAPAIIFNPQAPPPPGAQTGIPIPTPGGGGMIHDSVFGDSGGIDWGGMLEAGLDVAQDWYYGSVSDPGPGGKPLSRPPAGTYQTAGMGPGALGALAGMAGGAAGELIEYWASSGGDVNLFKPTATTIRPVSRIDRVGPDGRCATWLLATPYRWKVRGTLVGGRRHHHHRKR